MAGIQTSALAWRWLVQLLGFEAVVLPAAKARAQTIRAVVLSVGDGDTIRMRPAGRAITVRQDRMDASETDQGHDGQQARRYLQQRLQFGREVKLDVRTNDRYEHKVAEVMRGINDHHGPCGRLASLSLLEVPGPVRRHGVFNAEVEASLSPPWHVAGVGGIMSRRDFRRGRTSTRSCESRASNSGDRRYLGSEIGSCQQVQMPLRQGRTSLDGNGDGVACGSL